MERSFGRKVDFRRRSNKESSSTIESSVIAMNLENLQRNMCLVVPRLSAKQSSTAFLSANLVAMHELLDIGLLNIEHLHIETEFYFRKKHQLARFLNSL